MQKLRVGSCKAMSQLLESYELANTSYQLIFIYQPFPPPNQQPFLHQNHQLPSAENPHFPLFAQFRPLSHLIIWQFQTKVVILQQPSQKCHYDRENNLQNVSKQAKTRQFVRKRYKFQSQARYSLSPPPKSKIDWRIKKQKNKKGV